MNLDLDPVGGRRHRARRWSVVAGTAIGLAGAAFVIRTLLRDREAVTDAVAHARPGLLALALLLGGFGMVSIGIAWHTAVRVLGGSIGLLPTLRAYFVGQLGKYVPGGVWAVMGRGEWVRSAGVPGAVAYSSVLLSMGSVYLAAVLLAATLVPVAGLFGSNGDARYGFVLLLLPLGFALLHPRLVHAMLRGLRRVTGRDLAVQVPRWGISSAVVLQQVPSWLLIGLATYSVAVAFGEAGSVVNIVAATAISWVVGFVVLPVPGGIGVRETAFVALATSLSPAIAATVAVAARLVFVVVDATGAAVATLVSRRGRTPGR